MNSGESQKMRAACVSERERERVDKRNEDSIPQNTKKWCGNQCIIITIKFDGIFDSASAITPLGKICILMPFAQPYKL